MLAWMAWTWQTALFFCLVALALIILTLLAIYRPETPRVRNPAVSDDARRSVLRDPHWVGVHLCLLVAVGWAPRYPLVASVVYGIAMFRFA